MLKWFASYITNLKSPALIISDTTSDDIRNAPPTPHTAQMNYHNVLHRCTHGLIILQ